MKRLILYLLTFLSGIYAFAGSYTYNVTFDPNDLKFEYGIDGTDSVCFVTSSKLDNIGEIGAPSLPVKQIAFYVPQKATGFLVSVSSVKKETINLKYPVSKTNVALDGDELYFGGIEQNDSLSEQLQLRNSFARLANVSYLGGQYKIVHVDLYPAVVDSKNTSIYAASTFTVKLSYVNSGTDELYVFPSVKKNTCDRYEEYIKKNTVNARGFIGGSVINPVTVDMEEYTHIIITPARFAKSMERLVAMRRAKGISSKVFTLEQILNDSRFANGDTHSGITDDAGKLKEFLKYAYSIFGTRSVLFAGRYPEMPIRYAYNDEVEYIGGSQDKFVPCDFYFSELDNKWEKSDKYEGTYVLADDNFDILNELEVGRINVNSISEIDNYLDKLKNYEFNPGLGSPEYLSKILHAVQDNDQYKASPYSPTYKEVYNDDNSIVLKASEYDPKGLNGNDVIRTWNNNPVGHVNLHGHGNYGAIGVSFIPGGGSRGVTSVDNDGCWLYEESGNGLDLLSLEKYPSWGYSIACGIMPYDYKKENGEDITSGYNFADAYTIAFKSGGVIFLGNTRTSFSIDGRISNSRIYKALRRKYEDSTNIDYVEAGQIQDSLISANYNRTNQYLIRAVTGDPHAPLWTLAPQKFNISILDTDSLDNYYNIAPESVLPEKFKLAKSILIDESYSTTLDCNKEEIFGRSISDNYLHTILHKNYIPEILPLNIKNFTFWLYSSKYIFANKVNIGSDENTGEDNVTIVSINDVTIEALSDVNVKYGLYIQSDAKLTILSDGDVYLSQLHMGDNATLKIIANHIIYDKGDINNDGTYHLDFTQRMTDINPMSVDLKKNTPETVTPMVVEGRTWWYKAEEYGADVEYGIRIGSETEIDGKTYNKVYMCLNHKDITFENTYVDPTYTWMEMNEDEGLDAYIREEEGKVYVLFTVPERTVSEKYPGQRLYGFTGGSVLTSRLPRGENVDILMYDFTPGKGILSLGWGEPDPDFPWLHNLDFNLTGTETIESCGNEYNTYKYEFEAVDDRGWYEVPDKFTVVEGIGILTEDNGFTHCLFYNLFPAKLDSHNVTVELRYVTEGEDNHIIFEHIGGTKLWAEYDGVADIKVDAPDAAPEYYDMQGRRVENPAAGQLVIKRQGDRVTKLVVK